MAAARRQARQRAMAALRARGGASETRASRRRRGAVPCVLAAGLTMVAVAGCGSSGTVAHGASAGSAPRCLPASLEHSARLTGVPVDVSPAPGTEMANPHTQISFLGVPASEIRGVSVVGARSGRHSGRLDGYSQGNGASFVPDKPFAPGEQVVVRAVIGAAPAGRRIVFGFRVDTPYSTAAVPEFPNPPAALSDYQSFDTLPGVQAPILAVTVADHDPASGDIFISNGPGRGRYGPLIYTPQG